MRPLFTTIFLFVLFSCKKPVNCLEPKETLMVTTGTCSDKVVNEDINLCFDSLVEDSRCPSNAECVWQGVAKGKFRLKIQGQEFPFYLSTLDLHPHYNNDTIVGGYHFKLLDISPYPVSGNPPGNTFTAKVEITY